MVTNAKHKDLAALVALMREQKVLQVKLGDMEVVLHPEAFVRDAPPAPSAQAPKRASKAEAPESSIPTPDTDPALFEHLS